MALDEEPIGGWLATLSERTPTPGGGAVAALSAAAAAGLVGMVTAYTSGGKYADRSERMLELNTEAQQLRVRALQLADADEVAFGKVGDAYGMPKNTDEEKAARSEAIQAALKGAAEPPKDTGELAARVVELAEELVDAGNPNVVSDVAVAASSAKAAIDSAIVNIEINAKLIKDDVVAGALQAAVERLEIAATRAEDVVTRVRKKIG